MLIALLLVEAASASPVKVTKLDPSPTTAPNRVVNTTLHELITSPTKYDHKWVRFVGQIDRCQGFGCSVCPEDAQAGPTVENQCLPIDWDRQRGQPSARGFSFDPVYRYATVELVSFFNDACMTKHVICTDRATVLYDARAVRVIKRRSSALGISRSRSKDGFVDPPADVATELTTLLMNGQERGPAGPDYRVYASQSDPSAKVYAYVCRSYGKDDEAKWPINGAAVLAPSSEDRFHCYFADRKTGRWFIHPD